MENRRFTYKLKILAAKPVPKFLTIEPFYELVEWRKRRTRFLQKVETSEETWV